MYSQNDKWLHFPFQDFYNILKGVIIAVISPPQVKMGKLSWKENFKSMEPPPPTHKYKQVVS